VQSNRSQDRGAVQSGLLTGLSTAVVSGTAAIAGVILSRKFGLGAKTDGFFAAYSIYLAVVLVASVVRVVTLPRFVRAAADGRLGAEAGVWGAALALPLLPVVALALVWPHGIATLLTSNPAAVPYAAQLLPWVVVSAAAQVYGGIVAAALSARDDYVTTAFGFAAGSVAGLAATAALLDHGVIAFGWGLVLNGVLSLGIPLARLAAHGDLAWPDARPWERLAELVEGVALPVALQGLYVIANRFASGVGSGDQTTFTYGYLIAAFFVQLTATSLALVSTVPFARGGATPDRTARHVVAASWLSLAPIAAAAGVFALVGETVTRHVLGPKYGGATGAEISRLVVYLAPWMVASVAVTVAYPLLFVRGRARWLPALALGAVLVQLLVEWAGRGAFGLGGIAAGMAVTTALILAVLLGVLGALPRTARGLALAALVCGGIAAAAFGLAHAVLGPVTGALLGLVLYGIALGAWRPPGLRRAWAYVHALQ
jgi:O-antigen/teichoic acid export membrane protein